MTQPASPPLDPTPRRVRLPDDRDARAAVEVVTRLRQGGHQAFLVGGCVRDLLLGTRPVDWDVATGAKPEAVQAIFSRVIEVGLAFGVLRVVVGRGSERREVEVATFRADGAYGDGRRPDGVRFTDAREDVLRRDFTMNGLLATPLLGDASGSAEVVDLVGGIADLQGGVLRAIGEPADRLREDGLRILRAVRFAARFGLQIEPRTREALVAEAAMLQRVSPERILQELRGMLVPAWAVRAVSMMGALGLHGVLWPKLARCDPGLERAAHRLAAVIDGLGDAQVGAAAAPGHFAPVATLELPLGLCALFDDRLPQDRKGRDGFTRRLRLPLADGRAMDEISTLATALQGCGAAIGPPAAADPRDPALARLLRQEHADAALLLAIARARLSGRSVEGLRALRRLRAGTAIARWRPRLWVHGGTLRARGLAPGPAFKRAIAAAEDVQIAGGDRDAALAAALAALSDPDAPPSAQ